MLHIQVCANIKDPNRPVRSRNVLMVSKYHVGTRVSIPFVCMENSVDFDQTAPMGKLLYFSLFDYNTPGLFPVACAIF